MFQSRQEIALTGGVDGIRTHDTLLGYTPLAGERIQAKALKIRALNCACSHSVRDTFTAIWIYLDNGG